MNIFYLDEDFEQSAKYHVDKHTVKMPLEASQLLVDTILTCSSSKPPITKSGTNFRPLSKSMHNHPCAKFCRTKQGFEFTLNYLISLLKEYTFRYGKIHYCQNYVDYIQQNRPNLSDYTPFFPLAMPTECRLDNPILSYRNYYNTEKRHLFSWKNRQIPFWIS